MSQQNNNSPLVYIIRKESFSAAHTLNNKNLTPEENLNIFGKCNNCHGHNYNVEITVAGRVNPTTGMVINISILKQLIQDILNTLDHKNLDKDVEYFSNVVSTTENLTVYIWNELDGKLKSFDKGDHDCHLSEVKIFETDKNVCVYRGD